MTYDSTDSLFVTMNTSLDAAMVPAPLMVGEMDDLDTSEKLMNAYEECVAYVDAMRLKMNELTASVTPDWYQARVDELNEQHQKLIDGVMPPTNASQIKMINENYTDAMTSASILMMDIEAELKKATLETGKTINGTMFNAVFSNGKRSLTDWDKFETYVDNLPNTIEKYFSISISTTDNAQNAVKNAAAFVKEALRGFIKHDEPTASVKAVPANKKKK